MFKQDKFELIKLPENLFCTSCRKEISECRTYFEDAEVNYEDFSIAYEEKVAECPICNTVLYIPEIEKENNEAFQNAVLAFKKAQYAKDSVLPMIDQILLRYKIGKKPLSLILGWGESTIARYYQDDSTISPLYAQQLEKILESPTEFEHFLEMNQSLITPIAYKKSRKALNDLLQKSSSTNTSSKINSVCVYILMRSKDTTPLALQKLLYYTQNFYKVFKGEFLFEEDCEAWIHGPVYKEVYDQFKEYQYNPINGRNVADEFESIELSYNEMEILDQVIKHFGCYSGSMLKNMTHLEKPWIEARGELAPDHPSQQILTKESMADYFAEVQSKYKLLNTGDIADYSRDLFNKIQ